MLRKRPFEMLTIIVGVILVFSLFGCGGDLGGSSYTSIDTQGRLTITGLDEYIGYEIWGKGAYSLVAYAETLFSGSSTHKINTNSVTLMVYKESGGFPVEGYSGNDKNIIFNLYLGEITENVNKIQVRGQVTVDFTNGVGSGAFVKQ